MSQTEITAKVQELQELKRMQDELSKEIDALQDTIKAYMTEQGTECLIAGAFKVLWSTVTNTRLNTAALKKELPDIAERFTTTTTFKRFTVQ